MDRPGRLEAAAQLIRQSPPGQVQDVLTALHDVVYNGNELYPEIQTTLKEYNEEQLIPVDLDNDKTIISAKARAGAGYYDSKSQQTFQVDHLSLQISALAPMKKHPEIQNFESALRQPLKQYLGDRYPDGIGTVLGSETEYTLHIVDNKYNLSNFWTGRWRSTWTLSIRERTLHGVLNARVHYYEDGNVQVSIAKTVTIQLPDELVLPPIVQPLTEGSIATATAEEEPLSIAATSTEQASVSSEVPLIGGHEVQASETSQEISQARSTDEPLDTVGATEQLPLDEVAVAVEQPAEIAMDNGLSRPLDEQEISTDALLQQSSGSVESAEKSLALADEANSSQADVQANPEPDSDFNAAPPVEDASEPPASTIDHTEACKIIVKIISSSETAWHEAIQGAYETLNDKIFRALRRPLPVTKEKIKWENVAGYRLARVGAQPS